jgi:hypothetical protein
MPLDAARPRYGAEAVEIRDGNIPETSAKLPDGGDPRDPGISKTRASRKHSIPLQVREIDFMYIGAEQTIIRQALRSVLGLNTCLGLAVAREPACELCQSKLCVDRPLSFLPVMAGEQNLTLGAVVAFLGGEPLRRVRAAAERRRGE